MTRYFDNHKFFPRYRSMFFTQADKLFLRSYTNCVIFLVRYVRRNFYAQYCCCYFLSNRRKPKMMKWCCRVSFVVLQLSRVPVVSPNKLSISLSYALLPSISLFLSHSYLSLSLLRPRWCLHLMCSLAYSPNYALWDYTRGSNTLFSPFRLIIMDYVYNKGNSTLHR